LVDEGLENEVDVDESELIVRWYTTSNDEY
jgi:hypothetical protein